MASLLLPALVALASTVHGEAPFSCPKVAPAGVEPTEEKFISRPWVDGAVTFVGGKTGPWAGASKNVTSPIVDTTTGQRIVVGQMAQMKAGDALQVPAFPPPSPDTSATHPSSLKPLCSQAAEAAKAAWRAGQGLWPQMSPQQRIDAIERFVDGMLTRRAGIVNALMWEICKNTADAGATPAPARLLSPPSGPPSHWPLSPHTPPPKRPSSTAPSPSSAPPSPPTAPRSPRPRAGRPSAACA